MRKLELLRHLKQEEDAYAREELHQVLRLWDWLFQLSETQEMELRQELAELKPKTLMPFVTSLERYARQEGLEQGLERGREEGLRAAIREVLLARFDQVPGPISEALDACQDTSRLKVWLRVATFRPTLDAIATELASD